MATYNVYITIPATYQVQVEAPEGMSREQVMAMVTEQNIKEGEFWQMGWEDAAFFFNHEGGKEVEVEEEVNLI